MSRRSLLFWALASALVAGGVAPAAAGGKKRSRATIRLGDGRVFKEVRPLGGGRHKLRIVRGEDGAKYVAKTRDKRQPGARAEAAALASLGARKVRGVPRVVGFAYDQPTQNDATLVMTRSPGKSLADWFDAVRLPAPQVARVMAAAARVVEQAHAAPRGTAHIDLKPGNIMVVDPAATKPEVEVIDWETAAAIDSAWLGGDFTDAYAAPEMWDGRPRTARTDVYSLGATLEHMVTGLLPRGAAHPPRVQGIPRGLAAIITKATARDPADRYASAAAFAHALDTWASGRH